MEFKNKVVLVIGGSSGIGAATAVAFTSQGADVVIVSRNEEKMKNVAALCEKVGKTPLIVQADITKNEAATLVVTKTIEKYGKLDILINNAGIMRHGNIVDGKIMDGYDVVMNTNVRALVHITTIAAKHLIKTKGNIVNVSSISGQSSPTQFVAYAMSKAALDMFSKGAAYEFAAHGVRVNTVSPGPTRTDIVENSGIDFSSMKDFKMKIPLKRISESEEIADVILFLASDKAKGITGSIFVSDNGCLLE